MRNDVKMHEAFLNELQDYYHTHGRHDLPWRQPEANGSFDGYKILVSEVMLQQTQVPRVIPKYLEFLARFPSFQALADASLGEVLITWQGLGYNRRAKFLWQAAQDVKSGFGGVLPRDQLKLESLPGIGRNTAGAVLAYTYNEPAVFIETNIRTVYIHHFFKDHTDIPDKAILALVDETLNHENPREFYWALMDYGVHLKQTLGNLSRASKMYAKQSKFHGSLRQLRGKVLRQLASGPQVESVLLESLQDERAAAVLERLRREGMIRKVDQRYRLP